MFETWKLKKRCGDLEEQVARLESAQKQLELEWESTYDSLRRLAGKIARRQSHDAQKAREDASGSPIENPLDISDRIRAARHGVR